MTTTSKNLKYLFFSTAIALISTPISYACDSMAEVTPQVTFDPALLLDRGNKYDPKDTPQKYVMLGKLDNINPGHKDTKPSLGFVQQPDFATSFIENKPISRHLAAQMIYDAFHTKDGQGSSTVEMLKHVLTDAHSASNSQILSITKKDDPSKVEIEKSSSTTVEYLAKQAAIQDKDFSNLNKSLQKSAINELQLNLAALKAVHRGLSHEISMVETLAFIISPLHDYYANTSTVGSWLKWSVIRSGDTWVVHDDNFKLILALFRDYDYHVSENLDKYNYRVAKAIDGYKILRDKKNLQREDFGVIKFLEFYTANAADFSGLSKVDILSRFENAKDLPAYKRYIGATDKQLKAASPEPDEVVIAKLVPLAKQRELSKDQIAKLSLENASYINDIAQTQHTLDKQIAYLDSYHVLERMAKIESDLDADLKRLTELRAINFDEVEEMPPLIAPKEAPAAATTEVIASTEKDESKTVITPPVEEEAPAAATPEVATSPEETEPKTVTAPAKDNPWKDKERLKGVKLVNYNSRGQKR